MSKVGDEILEELMSGERLFITNPPKKGFILHKYMGKGLEQPGREIRMVDSDGIAIEEWKKQMESSITRIDEMYARNVISRQTWQRKTGRDLARFGIDVDAEQKLMEEETHKIASEERKKEIASAIVYSNSRRSPDKTVSAESKPEKASLKDAEDKMNRIIRDLSEDEQALLYKTLFNLGWKIDKAESTVRKGFRV